VVAAMNWHHGTFLFRDDDSATLQRILAAMQRDGHWITEPETPAYVLKIEDAAALIYLRMTVATEHDKAELAHDELLITAGNRSECERLLLQNCPSPVQWFRVVLVGTSTKEELEKFTALFVERHTNETSSVTSCDLADPGD
jgi:hypothetical protein